MCVKKVILGLSVVLVCLGIVRAQESAPAPADKTIKHVPVRATSPVSGKEMYTAYCAVCHGTDGKGQGPAASALKATPTDLTLLSKKNGGKYPSLKVTSSIHGDSDLPAHGSKDMPVWGTLFWNMSGGHEGEVQQRVANLTKYIETLQVK